MRDTCAFIGSRRKLHVLVLFVLLDEKKLRFVWYKAKNFKVNYLEFFFVIEYIFLSYFKTNVSPKIGLKQNGRHL